MKDIKLEFKSFPTFWYHTLHRFAVRWNRVQYKRTVEDQSCILCRSAKDLWTPRTLLS